MDKRDSFYNSKTSCFGIVEGLSFTVKCHTFHTKTSCFGAVMASDTFLRTITLTNKLTLNMLEAKVTLSSKKYWKKFPPEWLQEEVIIQYTFRRQLHYILLIFRPDFLYNSFLYLFPPLRILQCSSVTGIKRIIRTAVLCAGTHHKQNDHPCY